MASNSFLIPGTTTTITFLSDIPIEGSGPYGPYRAYRVRTEDGTIDRFYPPKYLADEVASLGICAGLVVTFRTSDARTREGKPYKRIEIADVARPAHPAPADRETREHAHAESTDSGARILASVALKCAAQTRNIADPEEVLETAVRYLTWLKRA